MLVSRERNRYAPINAEKVQRGVFLTTNAGWLLPQVRRFIADSEATVAVDPFVGDRHMLHHVRDAIGIRELIGYDIDPRGGAERNDSLVHIPPTMNGIIVTNPPYLANHSAKRKGVWSVVQDYFASSTRTDLYQIALDRCLKSSAHVVAIVPETFIRSDFPMHRLAHVSIIENALFEDTQCPVCVVCFGAQETPRSKKIIYRNNTRVCTFAERDQKTLTPTRSVPLTFNDPHGTIALRAVDLTDPKQPIQFLHREDIDYAQEDIKESSRLVTFISIPSVPTRQLEAFISRANELLRAYRATCGGVHLSPFKGNTRHGQRRRRLDYNAARAILEQAAADLGCSPHIQRLAV